MSTDPDEGTKITVLLQAIGGGGDDARERLYGELRGMARSKSALRRSGEWKRMELDGIEPTLVTPAERLRFFAGLREDEIADALGVSKRTVSRAWSEARARLAVLFKPPREG